MASLQQEAQGSRRSRRSLTYFHKISTVSTLNNEQCLSSRGFEYKQGSAPIVYKDRLRSKVDFWVRIGSSPWVLSIIRFG